MAFFDKKQEVMDIKLTQFGKSLLARGFFKPVYYRFFDDDIIYNSECAGVKEEQNRSEERILEAQRLKTQYLTLSLEEKFDQNQELINSSSIKTFAEISRRQDPMFAEAVLKYRDVKSQIAEEEIPSILYDTENYIDLTRDKIDFLDDTSLYIDRQDLLIDLQEHEVDLGLDNFEIELFEVHEQTRPDNTTKEILVRVENESKFKKILNVRTDSMIQDDVNKSISGRAKPRGRT
jgi:hypothetical protein